MNRFLPLLLALLLASCASSPKALSLEDSIRALIGHPAREARAILGNPDTIRPQGGSSLYIWTAKQGYLPPTPASSKTRNSAAEVAAALKQNPNAVQQPSSCVLTMVVTAGGIVASARLSGDPSRCGGFSQAFAGAD